MWGVNRFSRKVVLEHLRCSQIDGAKALIVTLTMIGVINDPTFPQIVATCGGLSY